jgi:Major Facilitator Superfamily
VRPLKPIFLFDAFSAMSWQMCLTSPLILFMRDMDASALQIGILAGLTPLMATLQWPMARHVSRFGFKKLMRFGWTVRTFVLMPLVALPLAVDTLGPGMIVWIVLIMVAVFTALRAVAVVAWMPWLSALIPADARGSFLARDRMTMNLTSLTGMALAGILLSTHTLAGYAAVFAVGTVAALVSLVFLNRIPDAPVPPPSAQPATPQDGLRDPRFRRIVLFAALAQTINIGTAALMVVFARDRVGLPGNVLIWLSASAALLAMGGLAWLRPRLDKLGSRPVLFGILGWWALSFSIWLLVALTQPAWSLVLAPVLLIGNEACAWLFEMNTMRLAMNSITRPETSTAYLAGYSVIVSLTAGVSPILLGALLDALSGPAQTLWPGSWGNYVAVFAVVLTLIGLSTLRLRKAHNA